MPTVYLLAVFAPRKLVLQEPIGAALPIVIVRGARSRVREERLKSASRRTRRAPP